MNIINNLKSFGLSEKESKTYIACLELGSSLASEISLKSNLPRTLVYDLLERLINLGLISYTIKDHKKYFTAVNPKELLRIIKEKEKSIKEILPRLEILQKIKGIKRPRVNIYEGKEGMKAIMNDILRSGAKEIICYGSSRSSYEIIPAFIKDWHKKRIAQRINMKLIYNDTKQARRKTRKFKSSLKLLKYKFMPVKLESPTATLIYGNKVILQSWTKDPFSVKIESDLMANNQRKYFDELWKIAKP